MRTWQSRSTTPKGCARIRYTSTVPRRPGRTTACRRRRAIQVEPGTKHTYTVPSNVPGTHLYHCHYQTQRHIAMGVYEIYRVDSKGYEETDKEYFMTVKE